MDVRLHAGRPGRRISALYRQLRGAIVAGRAHSGGQLPAIRVPAAAPQVTAGAAGSRVLLHVPHAGTLVPAWVRAHLLLDDAELAAEIAALTDHHTDALALAAADRAAVRPWVVVNPVSRFVVDVERFPDAREEMAAVGMGAVYTHGTRGQRLRADDPAHAEALLAAYFRPWGAAVAALVDAGRRGAARRPLLPARTAAVRAARRRPAPTGVSRHRSGAHAVLAGRGGADGLRRLRGRPEQPVLRRLRARGPRGGRADDRDPPRRPRRPGSPTGGRLARWSTRRRDLRPFRWPGRPVRLTLEGVGSAGATVARGPVPHRVRTGSRADADPRPSARGIHP